MAAAADFMQRLMDEADDLRSRRIADLDATDPAAVLEALGGRAVKVYGRATVQGGHEFVTFVGANGREVTVFTSAGGRQTAVLYEARTTTKEN